MFSKDFVQSVSGRCISEEGQGSAGTTISPKCKVIQPPLPSGVVVLNTVFLHADVTAHSYRVEDFRAGNETTGVLKEMAAIACYQFNNVSIDTLKSLAAKHRLLQSTELTVKGKPCLILDTNKVEWGLRLH